MIEAYTFNGCLSLTQILIPSSVTEIGDFAFNGCSSLEHISIPSSITSIGKGVFCKCTKLNQITIIPFKEKNIDYFENKFLILKKEKLNVNCNKLIWVNQNNKELIIPSFIKKIESYTFNGCSSLTQISIPSSVTSIGEYAFNGCSSLTQISIPSSVKSVGYFAFKGCTSLTQISKPSTLKLGNTGLNPKVKAS